jgi:hypothetical protein
VRFDSIEANNNNGEGMKRKTERGLNLLKLTITMERV